MNTHELTQLKAEIEQNEKLYLIELKTNQDFEKLRALRLKVKTLKQQLSAHESQEPRSDLSLM